MLRYDIPSRRQGNREVADYGAWIRSRLEQAGVRADAGVVERLLELVSDNPYALQAEIDKLADWAAGETVGVTDVERLVAPSDEMPGWALSDAWGARDRARALAACESMLEEHEPHSVAARLADHVSKVRAVAALLEDGAAVGEIAKRLGLKPYPARKQAAQARTLLRGRACGRARAPGRARLRPQGRQPAGRGDGGRARRHRGHPVECRVVERAPDRRDLWAWHTLRCRRNERVTGRGAVAFERAGREDCRATGRLRS